ncbi:hypothetical protein ACFFX0_03190 [Citricoccus parietis]|uniref:Uncharacterized protein n=1 Tax=Citricoccus parietis TaxID=592307 RepID=A0ABV5FU93_9MICC
MVLAITYRPHMASCLLRSLVGRSTAGIQPSTKGLPQAQPCGFSWQSSATFLDLDRQMSAVTGSLGTSAVPGIAIHGPSLTENCPRYDVVSPTAYWPVSS